MRNETLWSEEWIQAFWVSNGPVKIKIEPEDAVSRITHTTDYFQAMIFTLNKFITSRH